MLEGKAIVGGDRQRVVGSQMVTQEIQRLLVKLYTFVDLFLLAVVLQQYLVRSYTVRMLVGDVFESLLGMQFSLFDLS